MRSVWQTLKAERDQLGVSHDEAGRQADTDIGAAAGSAQRTSLQGHSGSFTYNETHPFALCILPILVNADSHRTTIAIKTWTQNHCEVPRTQRRLLPPAITHVFSVPKVVPSPECHTHGITQMWWLLGLTSLTQGDAFAVLPHRGV